MNGTANARSGKGCQLSLPEPSDGVTMSRGTLKCLLFAATALVISLFTHNVARLTDCKNDARNGDPVSRAHFLKNACPVPGPYTEQSNVFFYALVSPFNRSWSVGPEISAAGTE